MGGRKVVGRAKRSRNDAVPVEPVTLAAEAGEPFPKQLLDLFQRLRTPSSDGPPAKRHKTGASAAVDSITIWQRNLVAQRPTSGNIDPFDLVNLQSVLKFGLENFVDPVYGEEITFLTINTRPATETEALSAAFETDEDVPEKVIAVLNARDSFWSNPNVEDACWLSCDGQVRADSIHTTITLTFKLNWNISTNTYASQLSHHQRRFQQNVLALAMPDIFGTDDKSSSCSPQVFYEAAHVPDPDDEFPETAVIKGVVSTLYPFQRRAVKWLLRREGVEWSQDENGNSITEKAEPQRFDASYSFMPLDVAGQKVYISPVLGKVTRDPATFQQSDEEIKGGILSEEMGLGKTVELVALISLNPQPPGPDEVVDLFLGENMKTTSATLIVAPSSLREQWVSELKKHAPDLRVMLYQGVTQAIRDSPSKANALIDKLRTHDVVITTYSVLTTELDYVLGEPDRARRAPRKYLRPRSPLAQLRWWRVCMDEAQMIESGVSKSATVARLLPRVNAWGVTGTPVRDSVEDLHGLLLFLRYEPFASNVQAWSKLIQSHEDGFKRLFNQFALRHSKRLVRHEIKVPPQRRYVITMPFTAVEEQHYQTLFDELVGKCGFDANGSRLLDDWSSDDPRILDEMRTALDRLRQTALHPEVGSRNKRALGRRNGPMRTISEVLDAMIDKSDVAIRTSERQLFSWRLDMGQLLESSQRVMEALGIWLDVREANQKIVNECRKHVKRETELAKASKPDAKRSNGDESESDDDSDENNTGRVGEARRRLRSALEIQHKATFFSANAHFQIKSNILLTEPGSDEFQRLEKLESEGYEEAKMLRLVLLEESREKLLKLMKKISTKASEQSFATIPEYQALEPKGLESREIAEGLVVLAGELNDQADTLDVWREHVIRLLLKPLVDDEGEIEAELTGEEYDESTKLMEEIDVYIMALRTVVADREEALKNEVNELTKHEVKVSLRLATEGNGPFPGKLIELLQVRDNIKPKSMTSAMRTNSVKASLFLLRAACGKVRPDADGGSNRAKIELEIINEQLKTTQQQFVKQSKVAAEMTHELELFTATMNARLDFYRQLQNVSDQVGSYEGKTGAAEEEFLLRETEALDKKLDLLKTKHRYLLHLRDMDSADGESRMCVICRDTFTVGVLTVCGHQFCKGCISIWLKVHSTCPVCKRTLGPSNLHDITFKPQELKIRTESEPAPAPSPKKSTTNGTKAAGSKFKTSAIYTEFSAEKLDEIRNIELVGPSFTTKADNLARHLLWLRETSGAKSIVFSQYPDFLSVVGLALEQNGIGYTSFNKPNGTVDFREDPTIEVFLLHARAHASGLNLTNAANVFLCEPLVNTAVELQAIARVHRIGQEHETTVWLYIVDGTVEESIYNISVQRRLKHLHEGQQQTQVNKGKGRNESSASELPDEAIEVANSLELEQANLSKLMRKSTGDVKGEAVDKGDLWECLFGHVRRRQADGASNPGPELRGLLAAEAAEDRAREGESRCE